MPDPYNTRVTKFHRLMILRAIRPHRLLPALSDFLAKYAPLGPRYVEPPAFDMQAAYHDAVAATPLLFVLSAGADPVSELMKFAEANQQHKMLVSISLGQGQVRRYSPCLHSP